MTAGESDLPEAENRRRASRLQILGDLRAEILVLEPMVIREISRSGLLVETAFPLQLDSLHDIRLTLGDVSIVVKARVAHCRIGDIDQEQVRYRSGMEFTEVTDRAQAVIDRFIHTVESDRHAR